MTGLSYQSAGVDLELYEQSMQKLPELMKRTHTPGVMELSGGFAGLFRLAAERQWTDPVLVSGTDGVGTKLLVGTMLDRFDTIGIDLVAMCVNDCLCLGATPLFFLDYVAMGKDNPVLLEQLVRGISEGCQQAGAALIGGETAIMPDVYDPTDFDMAGFCVGASDRSELISGKERITAGDVVIGVPSSGFHSNGYSLVRKVIFEHAGLSVADSMPNSDRTVGEVLLEPTRIYSDTIRQLTDAVGNASVHGIAHITGGGLCENVERILPESVTATMNRSAWEIPAPFKSVQDLGGVAEDEMFRVFNMGLGLVIFVPEDVADAAVEACSTDKYPAMRLGHVTEDAGGKATLV